MLYAGAFAVLVVYLVATDGFDGWQFNVLYAVSVALMLLFMTAATRADWCQVVFFCTRAFILAGFAASLTWQMYVYFAKDNLLLQGLPALVLFICGGVRADLRSDVAGRGRRKHRPASSLTSAPARRPLRPVWRQRSIS